MAIRTHIGAGARRYRALVGLPAARWPLVFSVAGSMPNGMYDPASVPYFGVINGFSSFMRARAGTISRGDKSRPAGHGRVMGLPAPARGVLRRPAGPISP